jgi:hypothetical protein
MRRLEVAVGEVGSEFEISGKIFRVGAQGSSLRLQQQANDIFPAAGDGFGNLLNI